MSKEKKINIEDENLENTSAENEEVKNEEQTSECSADDVKEEDAVDPLEAAQEENAKLRDQLLRTIAEFENYKKRTLKEKAELILNG
jgi:molecular chaperone GrpE